MDRTPSKLAPVSDHRTIAAILELARWAPSGDNTQPWRFEVLADDSVAIHCFDTRHDCVYDLDGHSSQLAIGALIETVSLAASVHGLTTDVTRRSGLPEERPVFDVRFLPSPNVEADPLANFITERSVQRRALSTRALATAEKLALERSARPYRVQWVEGGRSRRRAAMLMFRSARLRLTMPEAYRVHRDVIEWNARFSVNRVPDRALGVDRASLALMRFAMKSWSRVHFLNRFFAGTWMPRLQMDLRPALGCAAHFVLASDEPIRSIDEYVQAGRAVQRFWLEATRLGLQLQPELTPLIFSRYARAELPFSVAQGMSAGARGVAGDLDRLLGSKAAERSFFLGRLGHGDAAMARSTRLEVSQLMAEPDTANR